MTTARRQEMMPESVAFGRCGQIFSATVVVAGTSQASRNHLSLRRARIQN